MPGAHLLVAAERAAQEAVDRQAEGVGDQPAGRPGGVELVLGEGAAVEAGPVEQVELAVVVRDERDALAVGPRCLPCIGWRTRRRTVTVAQAPMARVEIA